MEQSEYSFLAIAWVESCFKQKFGTPRQPGLVPSATAKIWMNAPFDNMDAFEGLESSSHLWLQFVFHQNKKNKLWSPKVRPPRLGGNKTAGVFATRSPNRPNPIGLSVVKNEGVHKESKGIYLLVSGVDMIDGTPILDIKPYVPYVDSVVCAINELAPAPPKYLLVNLSKEAELFCQEYFLTSGIELKTLIVETLQQDPRPQYHSSDHEREYAAKLLDVDVRWKYCYREAGVSLWVVRLEFT